MGLRATKHDQTLRDILRAAADLFRTQGYAGATMNDIAQRAGISRGTLFNYLKIDDFTPSGAPAAIGGKDAIVLALATPFENGFPAELRALLQIPLSTGARITRAYQLAEHFFTKHHELNKVIFSELLRIRSQYPQATETAFAAYRDSFRELIDAGLAQGDVRRDIATHTMAELLTASLLAGIHQMFVTKKDHSSNAAPADNTFSAYAKLMASAIIAEPIQAITSDNGETL